MKNNSSYRGRIVIPAPAPEKCRGTQIRVTPEAMEVISRLIRRSGLSARHLVSEILIRAEGLVEFDYDAVTEDDEL